MLREHPVYAALVHGWFLLLFAPAGRAYWLDMADNERDRGLATAALGGMDRSTDAREALRARIYKYHDEKRAAIQRRYKGWLMQ
jgi:hypothetical protein